MRLGAGWLVRSAAVQDEVQLPILDRIDFGAVSAALLNSDMHPRPRTPAQLPLTSVAGGYVLLVLVLLRFGGTPGLVTGFAVAVLAGVTAWLYLRPPAAQTVLSRAVVTSGGALARRDEVRSLFTLPRAAVQVPGAARPTASLPYTQTNEQFEVALARWGAADLVLRPHLVDAALRWQNGTLHNAGPDFLSDLFVLGLGPQPGLAAGATLTPQPTEEGEVPTVYKAVAGLAAGGDGDRPYRWHFVPRPAPLFRIRNRGRQRCSSRSLSGFGTRTWCNSAPCFSRWCCSAFSSPGPRRRRPTTATSR